MLSFFVKKGVEVPCPEHLQGSGMVPLLYHNRLLRRCPLIPESLNQPTTLKGGLAAAWGPTGCASLCSLLAGWPRSRRPLSTHPLAALVLGSLPVLWLHCLEEGLVSSPVLLLPRTFPGPAQSFPHLQPQVSPLILLCGLESLLPLRVSGRGKPREALGPGGEGVGRAPGLRCRAKLGGSPSP